MRSTRISMGSWTLATFVALTACGTTPENGTGHDDVPGTSGSGQPPSTGSGQGGILIFSGSGGAGAGTLATSGAGGVGAYDTTSAIAAGTGGSNGSASASGGANAGTGGAGSGVGGASSGSGAGGASSGSGTAGSGTASSGAGGASSGSGSGTPCATDADCADAYSCTIDTCDLATSTCVNTPSDALCPGALCDPANGAPGTGCTPVGGGCTAPTDGGNGAGGGALSSGGAGGGAVSSSTGGATPPGACVVQTCQGKVYACGDCVDNDGDGLTDMDDPMCVGPCDNTEDSFYDGIPGQNNAPCKADCYFDQDSGSGNDQCYWDFQCDPLESAPSYSPAGAACAYDPNASISGYGGTCADAAASQPDACHSFCGPLTPNGCDCFGCCTIPGAPTPVYLGSENGGVGSCTLGTLNDPTKCKPCTPNPACENTCEKCELCVGKSALPPECSEPSCPAGVQSCSPCGAQCPAGYSCITGCCSPNP